MKRKIHGITLSVLIGSAVAGGVWGILPSELELARKIPAFFAAISMLSMALAMFISIRPKWIEPLVGGMDKAYIYHKWLGIWGLLGASFHWLLVPGPAGNGIDPQFAEVGEELGQFAMYALLLIGGVSMVKSLPYRWWFYTHKLMGPVFLISVYHTFFSDVPFEVMSSTGLALLLISALGVSSWVYKTFFNQRHIKQYRVTRIDYLDDALEVFMVPINSKIDYQAGQFAYIDFGFDKIEHFHPFTIASAPQSAELSFMIRALGKHTTELQTRVKVGQEVSVDGGYGRMHVKRDLSKPQIWIAGGIGITPFLAWLRGMSPSEQEVHLFYMGRGHMYPLVVNKLLRLANTKNIHVHTKENDNDVLTGNKVCLPLTKGLESYQVFACGPKPMLTALSQQLKEKGMSPTQWYTENFVMR